MNEFSYGCGLAAHIAYVFGQPVDLSGLVEYTVFDLFKRRQGLIVPVLFSFASGQPVSELLNVSDLPHQIKPDHRCVVL